MMLTTTIQHKISTASAKLESDELIETNIRDTLDIDASGEADEYVQPTVQSEENDSGSSYIPKEEHASGSGGYVITSKNVDNFFSSIQYTRLRDSTNSSRSTRVWLTTLKHGKSTPMPSRKVTDIAGPTRRHMTTSLPPDHQVDARIMSAVGIGMILILTIVIFVLYRKKKLHTTATFDLESIPMSSERGVSNARFILHEIKRDDTQNGYPSKRKFDSPPSDFKPEVLRKDADLTT